MHASMRPNLEEMASPAREAVEPGLPPALRFLVVDDNEDIRVLLVQLLERLGHCVTAAPDGADAVQKLAVERYDFMLLDLTMPRISGQDVLRWLREHPERADGLQVVVVSALAEQHRRDLEELGVHAILPKPLRTSQLRDVITDLISGRCR